MFKDTSTFSGFSVDDMAAAKEFYGRDAGARREPRRGPASRSTLAGGANLFAYGKEDHQPATFTVLNFEVDDVDAAVDRLTEAGVEMEHYDGMTDDKGVIARSRAR